MLQEYKQYCSNPTYSRAKDLWQSILAYDHTEDQNELIEVRTHYAARPHLTDIYLASNGTIGEIRHYPFGPHANFWLTQIEDHVKYRHSSRYVGIHPSLLVHPRECHFSKAIGQQDSVIPIEYLVTAPLHQQGSIEFIIDKLDKIGPFALSTTPNNWLYLLKQTTFRQFLRSSQMTSAMSTGWEAFYRSPPAGVHFNDNMVNWTTGMNFYTCQHGVKHFLPTFALVPDGIINLLNLAQPAVCPIDDYMTVYNQVLECACGRRFQKFNLIPRVDHNIRSPDGQILYDLSLADKLKSSYLNLQFVQVGLRIHVYYSSADIEPDRETIFNFFSQHGLEVVFRPDRYVEKNTKFPVFWQTSVSKYRNYHW